MIFFFNNLSYAVLVAIQDDGSRYIQPAVLQLKKLGAYRMINSFRGSFAFVGYSGFGKRSWVKQVQNRRGKGPSSLKALFILHRRITCRK